MQATETFQAGTEQFTVAVEIDLNTVWLISGDFSGTIPNGQIGFINGDVHQTGDVFVEGLLTGVDTFHWQGNGFSVFFQNGGQSELHGKVKGKWGEWGTGLPRSADTTGWLPGDRLVIAATKVGVYNPSEGSWTGNWATTIRPVNSPDVVLPPNPWRAVAKPEVANLSQSIVIENLLRGFHFHDSAGVQNLSDVKFLNCGQSGVIGNYPVHFHLLGDSSRGSLLERVAVEGGKKHAFVPHGSHGITLRDTVAYNTIGDPYWWDDPVNGNTANNSLDTLFEHPLAIKVGPQTDHTLAAFLLGAGSGNVIKDAVATGVVGGASGSGMHWPSKANQNSGGNVWDSERLTNHNNRNDGIFVWQNDANNHVLEDVLCYHNRLNQIEHGAYSNNYDYKRLILKGGEDYAFLLHATGNILLEDVYADMPLRIAKHTFGAAGFAVARRCGFPSIIYGEMSGTAPLQSKIRYEDWHFPLTPAHFTLTSIHPNSIIEITSGGVLTHRWASGVWT